MCGERTRRDVLVALATTGALATVESASGTAESATNASDRPSLRPVEIGIAYDVPERSDYGRVHLDARSGLSVDGARSAAVAGDRVRLLPTTLSPRKRVCEAIELATPHEFPSVSVRWTDGEARASIDSRESFTLPPGTTHERTLEAETVDVNTRRTTDERAALDGEPDWLVSVGREYGTATVRAVPRVELTNHGRFAVSEESGP